MGVVKSFSELSMQDVDQAGGKGASLGEMTQATIPVPPGFVILADSFEQFINDTGIKEDLDAQLHKVNHKEIHTVERASETIQAVITEQEIPEEIAEEILAAFDALGAEFVAIRSSATAEDSKTAAWAGQLDTFLNTTRENVLENVRKCWASLFTPRAIFYRFEKQLHGDHISVAVVVQKMVNSDVAGIAFSVHPVTQAREHLIIEAGLGLGEAVVSGQITPDSYVVEKGNWEMIEKHVSEQTRGMYRKPEGGNEWKDLGDPGSAQKISDEDVVSLAKLVVQIEEHYGFPVDIEFAIENSEFFITQSRPITTLT